MSSLLFLCTGNATRSVLAAALVGLHRPDLAVNGAGTLVIEGCPVSGRTRAGFEAIGLEVPPHRSTQARADDLHGVDVVVGLAPEHVEWVRREHSEAAGHTVTLKRLHRDLSSGHGRLRERVTALEPASIELEEWEEVIDPGGLETDAYVACAREISMLVDELAPRL